MAKDILIVDDEDDIRDLISGLLEDEGYQAREAADADGALQAIRSHPELNGLRGTVVELTPNVRVARCRRRCRCAVSVAAGYRPGARACTRTLNAGSWWPYLRPNRRWCR